MCFVFEGCVLCLEGVFRLVLQKYGIGKLAASRRCMTNADQAIWQRAHVCVRACVRVFVRTHTCTCTCVCVCLCTVNMSHLIGHCHG